MDDTETTDGGFSGATEILGRDNHAPGTHLTTSTDAAPDLKKSVESSTSGTLGRIRIQELWKTKAMRDRGDGRVPFSWLAEGSSSVVFKALSLRPRVGHSSGHCDTRLLVSCLPVVDLPVQ